MSGAELVPLAEGIESGARKSRSAIGCHAYSIACAAVTMLGMASLLAAHGRGRGDRESRADGRDGPARRPRVWRGDWCVRAACGGGATCDATRRDRASVLLRVSHSTV